MIDFHHHFCNRNDYKIFLKLCQKTDIEKAALISLPDNNRIAGNYNSEVKYALDHGREKFLGFGAMNHQKIRGDIPVVPYDIQVEKLHADGFAGVKIWLGKPLTRDLFGVEPTSSVVKDLLSASSDLGLTVLYHAADPPDFWEKGGIYQLGNYRSFQGCIEDFCELAGTFPRISFIGAHLLFLAGSLDNLSEILVSFPNIYLDTAPGRWFLHELDTVRDEAADFFYRFRNRLLFGTDSFFFPADIHGFSVNSRLKKRIVTIKMYKDFFFSNKYFKNPYQGSKELYPTIKGLGLSENIKKNILTENGLRFW